MRGANVASRVVFPWKEPPPTRTDRHRMIVFKKKRQTKASDVGGLARFTFFAPFLSAGQNSTDCMHGCPQEEGGVGARRYVFHLLARERHPRLGIVCLSPTRVSLPRVHVHSPVVELVLRREGDVLRVHLVQRRRAFVHGHCVRHQPQTSLLVATPPVMIPRGRRRAGRRTRAGAQVGGSRRRYRFAATQGRGAAALRAMLSARNSATHPLHPPGGRTRHRSSPSPAATSHTAMPYATAARSLSLAPRDASHAETDGRHHFSLVSLSLFSSACFSRAMR